MMPGRIFCYNNFNDLIILLILGLAVAVIVYLAVDAIMSGKPHRYLVSLCLSLAIASLAIGVVRSSYAFLYHMEVPAAVTFGQLVFRPCLGFGLAALVFSLFGGILAITSRKE